tara:strand:- start:1049 stop:1408 length:360 start_codon:yes stop_codon:yes gene_type:complete
MLSAQSANVQFLTRCTVSSVVSDGTEPAACVGSTLSATVSIHMELGAAINVDKEVARMDKAMAKVSATAEPIRSAMALANYETNVPEAVRAANTEKLAAYDGELASLEARKAKLNALRT